MIYDAKIKLQAAIIYIYGLKNQVVKQRKTTAPHKKYVLLHTRLRKTNEHGFLARNLERKQTIVCW
jgi:hypothetical protein